MQITSPIRALNGLIVYCECNRNGFPNTEFNALAADALGTSVYEMTMAMGQSL